MTIIDIARGRTRRERPRHHEARRVTPSEARLLSLRPATAAVTVHYADRLDLDTGRATRLESDVPSYLAAAFWLVVLAVFGIGLYVIDRGGHAAPRTTAPSTLRPAGSGRMAVTVAPGDLTVRVTLRSSATPWFWCLESSRGLPAEQHLCRNSSEAPPSTGFIATEGMVHLDAAAVQGADFFVEMYCRDECDWHAVAAPLKVRNHRPILGEVQVLPSATISPSVSLSR